MVRHVGEREQEEGGRIARVVGRQETVLLDAGQLMMDLPGLLSGLRHPRLSLVARREHQLRAECGEIVREKPVREAVTREVARITGDAGLVEPVAMTQRLERNGGVDAGCDHTT